MRQLARRTVWVGAAAIAALVMSPLHADTLRWEGAAVSGELTDDNYFNVQQATSGNIPTPADLIELGGQGVVTFSTPGPYSLLKLRVGHASAPHNGPATLTASAIHRMARMPGCGSASTRTAAP